MAPPLLREEGHGSLMQGRGSEAGYKASGRDLGGPAQLRGKVLSWDTAPAGPCGGALGEAELGEAAVAAGSTGAGRQSEAIKRLTRLRRMLMTL